MDKPLTEMTDEELWKLFPVVLSDYNPLWRDNYLAEKAVIEQAAGIQNIARLNHIGSTAVPGLIAKPTIDILLEIKDGVNLEKLVAGLKSAGYIYLKQPANPAPHMMFLKGYTRQGFEGQAFHVHVRYGGDWDELYFRDYLLAHPAVADEYGRLKIKLKKKYEHDRDGYTRAKSAFIKRITGLARQEMKNYHGAGR